MSPPINYGSTSVEDWTETNCFVVESVIVQDLQGDLYNVGYVVQFAVLLPSNSSTLYTAVYWQYQQDISQSGAEADLSNFFINTSYPCSFNVNNPPTIYNTAQTYRLYLGFTLGELQSLRAQFLSFIIGGNAFCVLVFLSAAITLFSVFFFSRRHSPGKGGDVEIETNDFSKSHKQNILIELPLIDT